MSTSMMSAFSSVFSISVEEKTLINAGVSFSEVIKLRKMDTEMGLLVRMLGAAAKALAEYYHEHHKGAPLVVLGRDAWPLVPMLREKYGIPAQYFLFSRLQIGDKGTEAQWLKEVPKGALVVDTGYRGSIFDSIKEFDPSISGVLICSSGEYPQLSLWFDHQSVVKEIEKMPKIIGRCVAIDSEGKARCPQDTRDDDEKGGWAPQNVVSWNKALMVALGLPLKWASFTGLVPKDRVAGSLKLSYLKAKLSRKEKEKEKKTVSRFEERKLLKQEHPRLEYLIKNFMPGEVLALERVNDERLVIHLKDGRKVGLFSKPHCYESELYWRDSYATILRVGWKSIVVKLDWGPVLAAVPLTDKKYWSDINDDNFDF